MTRKSKWFNSTSEDMEIEELREEIALRVSGSYTDEGVRRWFLRPRTRLDGKTPEQVLSAASSVDDHDVLVLLELVDYLES